MGSSAARAGEPGNADTQAQCSASRLSAVLALSRRLNSEHNLSDLLDLVAEEAARLLDCERASLFLFNADRTELHSKVALGSSQMIRVAAGAGIAGEVAQTGVTRVVSDAYSDPQFFQGVDYNSGYRTRNMVAVALKGGDGTTIGTFELLNKRSGAYSAEDIAIAESLAGQAGLAIQNAQLIEELKRRRETLESENRTLLREIGGRTPARLILGASARIEALRTMIANVADCDVTVLITGESGTGKDLVARSLHYGSPRSREPFVAMNCAALPESLVESELFGVEKGVATGVERRAGKFEAAHGGTLFLDEIGDLSLTAQAKILRALQERAVERLGGHKTIAVDVRIVAATNRDLELAIREGKFREDLYYRLNVIHLQTPPLREIRDDVPLLARHLLREASMELKRPEAELSDEAIHALMAYEWRGNVRQLQNEMRRAVIYARNGVVGLSELSPSIRELGTPVTDAPALIVPPSNGASSLAEQIEGLERARIAEVLEACGYNQVKTAKRLGLSRQGLINKLKRYGLLTPAARSARGGAARDE